MLRVVLVDDEQIILDGLQRVLDWAKYGCQVVATAADGLEGINIVRREKPDILFTDIRMPNLDGLRMIAALKSEMPNMQISVLTAFREFDYAQQAINLGVTRYLLKPSKMPELEAAVEVMVSRCKALESKSTEDEVSDAPLDCASSFIVNAALAYIRSHYTEPIRLNMVADSVYVSQWHLSKLINRHLGQSFLDVVNALRIQRAQDLLSDPQLKVQEIAVLVGFSDVSHFSNTFKRIKGLSPAAYRQRLAQGQYLI